MATLSTLLVFENEEIAKTGEDALNYKTPGFDYKRHGKYIKYSGIPSAIDPAYLNYKRKYPLLKMCSDYTQYLENTLFSDVDIKVTDGSTSKVYKAHKVVLAANSEYFQTLFTGSFPEAKNRIITIKNDLYLFEKLLDIIYGKSVRINGLKGLRILQMADTP